MLIWFNMSYSSGCLSGERLSKSPSIEMNCREGITGIESQQMLSDSELFASDFPFSCKCMCAVNGAGFVSLLVPLRQCWKHISTSNIMDLRGGQTLRRVAVSSKQLPTHPLCRFFSPAQSVIFTIFEALIDYIFAKSDVCLVLASISVPVEQL